MYTAHPDQPDVMAGLAAMEGYWDPDLACLKAWESGPKASVDLRPLLEKIACPTLVVAGEADFGCGPAQAVPIASAIPDAVLRFLRS
jgi:pimeloyl-ACP methyl ester carboxylesterase